MLLGAEVCIQRAPHIGTMRKTACGASNMRRRSLRGSMLCSVSFGSLLSRQDPSTYHFEILKRYATFISSCSGNTHLVAEFESAVGTNHGPGTPGTVL